MIRSSNLASLSFIGACALGLAACDSTAEDPAADPPEPAVEEVQETEVSGDYDTATVAAAQACHDQVWLQDERFKDLPNAAVSIVQASLEDDDPAIGWTVEWDDPEFSVSGTCTVEGDQVTVIDN